MMPAAPDLFPTLDDALRALDDLPGRPFDAATVLQFLEQLEQLRAADPAVELGMRQQFALEAAYQAGVRCADTSGQLLVVSTPALLELMGHGTPSTRLSWRAKLEEVATHRPFLWLAGLFAIGELFALLNAAILQGHSPLLALVLVGGAVYLDALLKLRKKGSK